MDIIELICSNPDCQARFSIPHPGTLEDFPVQCPECKTQLIVKPRPHNSGKHSLSSDDAEMTVPAIQPKPTNVSLPRLVCEDSDYPMSASDSTYILRSGINSIGREKSSSRASLQIRTSNRTISGNHIIINLIPLKTGGFRAELRLWENKNKTTLQGKTMVAGDVYELFDGFVIGVNTLRMRFEVPKK